MLKNYKEAFKLGDKFIADQIKAQRTDNKLHGTIEFFEVFLKKLLSHYKNLRAHLKGLIEVKQHQVEFQRNLVGILGKYEERNLIYANEVNPAKLILGGSGNEL